MLSPARLLRRLRWLFSSRHLDEELDDELRFHLEMEVEKYERAGLSKADARAEAMRTFGGGWHRDASRDARGVRPLEDLLHDLRVGARAIMKQPTYAIVATLTLAIGIGATTALGAAVYRVLFAPYPFPDAERIVTVWETDTRTPGSSAEVAPANFRDLRARATSFELMAAAEPYSFDWIGPEGPEKFNVTLVTEDFFAIQGLRPLLGRAFLPDEFRQGNDNVLIITERTWRARLGADSSLVGRTLVLDSVPRIVVGVMPEDALRPFAAEMFAPKIFRESELTSRTSGYWEVGGKLREGVSLEQANTELASIAKQLAAEHPSTNSNTGAIAVTLRETIAGYARTSLLVLLGAVGFVLLIACVNVASLQLAEAIRRRRELAIRTAIGAGRGRLVRQLLTESALVAGIGCIAGLVIAYGGIRAIRAFAPVGLWQLQRLAMDGTAIVLAAALAAICATVVAVLPIVAAGRFPLAESLGASNRGASLGIARRRASRALVMSEVALALVLLVGAGLMMRSLAVLGRVDRGFDERGVVAVTVQAWGYYPTPQQRAEFVRAATERLAALPGVEVAGMTSSLPLTWPIGQERTGFVVEGQSIAPGDELPSTQVAAITPGYFEALRIPLRSGRQFTSYDASGSPRVVLVNEAFAHRIFRDENPIGQRLTFRFAYSGAPLQHEIVGVVGDVRHEELDADPEPAIFVPHAQASTGAIHFVARVTGDPATYERTIRHDLAQLNGAMPISGFTTMEALLRESLRERRFQLGLLACFSATALLLAAIGIYGVMSRATAERTHEIGVRMAVGAEATSVRMLVLRSGGTLAVAGIIIGLAAAFALTRYMAGMLYGVTPLDPLTYAAAAVLLLTAALLATLLPAWRASAVDPVEALRND
ncbi:MAG: ADOP family duplicated permease [Gemmatimonadaceae bacterium]